MFIRKRKKPLTLQKLETLIPRLSLSCKQLPYIKQDAAKLQKGYNGERRLDFYLQSLSNNYYILSDVGLEFYNRKFQIDSLIISPHAMYLIETKNFEGTLTFDTIHRQMIQSNNNQEKSFTYPITQADNAAYLMMQWLENHQLNSIPIQTYIAIAQKSTIIRVQGDDELITKYVIQAEDAPLRLIHQDKQYGEATQADPQRRNKIASTIMTHVQDFSVNIMEKYQLTKEDINSGTRCSSCSQLNMTYNQGKWICPDCGETSKSAHIATLQDYFLLIDSKITIKEAQRFLKISDRHKVYRILKKSNLLYDSKLQAWIRTKNKK